MFCHYEFASVIKEKKMNRYNLFNQGHKLIRVKLSRKVTKLIFI